MSAHRYRLSKDYARDAAGAVAASAHLFFYVTGTTTPLDTYSDAGLSSANTNPVVADSAGLFGDIFLGNGGPFKAVLKNSGETVTYFTEDPIYRARVWHYLAALPSVNWPGMLVVLSTDNHLYERNIADSGWNDRGDADAAINAATVTETLTGTSTAKAVTPDALAGVWQRGANLTPSGGTVTLDSGGGGVFNVAAGNFSAISSAQGGRAVLFVFGGASVITYNATSMILPGSANITTVAGDCGLFVNEAAADASGSNWRCVWFDRRSGSSVNITDHVSTQSAMETGTEITSAVTPGRVQYHPGVAKFWVNATANSTTINASHNVTSVADTATGRMTVTIATNFNTASWVCHVSIENVAAGNQMPCIESGGQAAGTVIVECRNGSAALQDPAFWHVSGFGDQA